MSNLNYTRGIGGNHNKDREKDDYYATPPRAIDDLISKVELHDKVWEVACGGGHLSSRLESSGHIVKSTDLVDRGYVGFDGQLDFINSPTEKFDGDIVTNPPYKLATEFVEKSLDSVDVGGKVCMFLKIQFLEGQKRYEQLYSKGGLKHVLVYSKRISTARNADFDKYKTTAMCHAWFVWEKGYKGLPNIDWV